MNYTELAKICGVSKSTVSRALRNDPILSKATIEKVQETARKMGYQQNPFVSAWMSHVRKRGPAELYSTIGWLSFEKKKDFWTKPTYFNGLIKGARKQLELCQCNLEEFWIHERKMSPNRLVQILKSRGISGLLIPHYTVGSIGPEIEEFRKNFHCVAIDKPIPDLPCVGVDLFGNMRMAIQSARQLGYRKIGFCAYRPHETGSDYACCSRYLAYNNQIEDRHRIPYLEVEGDNLELKFLKWFERYRPEVVICQNPFCKPALSKAGYRIPEDVGIVHTNLNDVVAGMTGIQQRHPRIGAKAASLLLSQMSQPHYFDDINAHVYVSGKWVEGETTKVIPPTTTR